MNKGHEPISRSGREKRQHPESPRSFCSLAGMVAVAWARPTEPGPAAGRTVETRAQCVSSWEEEPGGFHPGSALSWRYPGTSIPAFSSVRVGTSICFQKQGRRWVAARGYGVERGLRGAATRAVGVCAGWQRTSGQGLAGRGARRGRQHRVRVPQRKTRNHSPGRARESVGLFCSEAAPCVAGLRVDVLPSVGTRDPASSGTCVAIRPGVSAQSRPRRSSLGAPNTASGAQAQRPRVQPHDTPPAGRLRCVETRMTLALTVQADYRTVCRLFTPVPLPAGRARSSVRSIRYPPAAVAGPQSCHFFGGRRRPPPAGFVLTTKYIRGLTGRVKTD